MRKNCILPTILLVCLFSLQGCGETKQQLETKHYAAEESYRLVEGLDAAFYLKLEVDFPIRMGEETTLHQIQTKLLEELFGERYNALSIEEAITEWKRESESEYKLNNLPLLELFEEEEYASIGALSNEHHLMAKPIFESAKVLSYVVERYVYMGGAHGINTRTFYNFNLEGGELLSEKSLFIESYQTALTHLLLESLMESNSEVGNKVLLESSDYFVESIVPNNNFYITNNGIVYLFNPYEIAPYVFGETELFIEKERLEAFLSEFGREIFTP